MAQNLSKNLEWLSVHLFYTNHDFLLINGVKPFIDAMKSKDLVLGYFFIRYWEKGPHIRLRLKVEGRKIPEIKQLIEDYFIRLMEKHPSVRKQEFPGFYANNSIHYIDYIPETERYGGTHALRVAELHFEHSSDTILNLMTVRGDEWSFPIAQALAIQLHILFLNAIEITTSNKLNMLKLLAGNEYWRGKAKKFIPENENIEDIFDSQFQKNKLVLHKMKEEIEHLIETETLLKYSQLYRFYQSVQNTDVKLLELATNKKIEFELDEQTQRTRLYISYLHMLNNRIGLKNHDEAYIDYINYRLFTDNIC